MKNSNKRTRTVMTPMQSKVLHKVLEQTAFPDTSLRELLAKDLSIKPRTVQIWFQNQRQKAKSLHSHFDGVSSHFGRDGMITPPIMPLDVLASAALNFDEELRREQNHFENDSS